MASLYSLLHWKAVPLKLVCAACRSPEACRQTDRLISALLDVLNRIGSREKPHIKWGPDESLYMAMQSYAVTLPDESSYMATQCLCLMQEGQTLTLKQHLLNSTSYPTTRTPPVACSGWLTHWITELTFDPKPREWSTVTFVFPAWKKNLNVGALKNIFSSLSGSKPFFPHGTLLSMSFSTYLLALYLTCKSPWMRVCAQGGESVPKDGSLCPRVGVCAQG